jgi:signal peptidase I
MIARLIAFYRKHLAPDIGVYALAFGAFLVFHTTAYASYFIPSESMVPTLQTGDHIEVAKFAYGYSRFSMPLALSPRFPTTDGRVFEHAPKRGDIVVFAHPRTHETMIKRLIGLPGDRIQMKEGRLYINGREVPRRFVRALAYRDDHGRVVHVSEYEETLPGGREHEIYEQSDHGYADNTGIYVVPRGHLFMMGDNRDNSADSRFINDMGYVPMADLIGRTDLIAFSLHHCRREAGLTCPGHPFLVHPE